MKKPILAVDVDEVLYPFTEEFFKYYNQRYGTSLSSVDLKSSEYEETLGLSIPETTKRIAQFLAKSHQINPKPLQESQEAISKLSKLFDIYVVTARDSRFEDKTILWLDRYFKDMFIDVHSIGYRINYKERASKATVCKQIKAKYIIDDSLENILDCSAEGIKGLLFGNYPWNKANKLPDNVIRVNNWNETTSYLFKEEQKV